MRYIKGLKQKKKRGRFESPQDARGKRRGEHGEKEGGGSEKEPHGPL